jgi:hypothetical protein|tara:strand:+ start:7825 stop:8451 length:627 start_codon:yes stop_codon:yes gene_type:complete
MAGAGYKDFTAGDVLTAAQVDTYLMEQTTMVFASASARDTALSTVKASGMLAHLTDAPKRTTRYDGSAWNTIESDWAAFTASWSSFTIGNGTQTHSYRYVPGGMRCTGIVVLGSSSSVGGAVFLTLPNSQTIRGTATNNKQPYGQVTLSESGALDYSGSVLYGSSSSVVLKCSKASATYLTLTNTSSTIPFTWGTSDGISYDFTVPVG